MFKISPILHVRIPGLWSEVRINCDFAEMVEKVGKIYFLLVGVGVIILTGSGFCEGKQCIDSKVASPCFTDEDCILYQELHLYCNTTEGANVCAFQVETYAGQAGQDMDCPGLEFSAEPWSNPIGDEVLQNSTGVDCMRWCYFTETCFGAVVRDHKCYLKNDNCLSNLRSAPGVILGVMSTVREDYHCGCHYPFTRRRSNGEIFSWVSDCPESQSDRNPYRCCSPKGLCIPCADGETPPPPLPRTELHEQLLTK